jgi:hypothetical protein
LSLGRAPVPTGTDRASACGFGHDIGAYYGDEKFALLQKLCSAALSLF